MRALQAGDVVSSDWLTPDHVGFSCGYSLEAIVDWVARYRIDRSVGGSECCELGIIEMLYN